MLTQWLWHPQWQLNDDGNEFLFQTKLESHEFITFKSVAVEKKPIGEGVFVVVVI